MAGKISQSFSSRAYTIVDDANFPRVDKQIKIDGDAKAGSPIKYTGGVMSGSLNITGTVVTDNTDDVNFIVVNEAVGDTPVPNGYARVVGKGAVVSLIASEAVAVGNDISFDKVEDDTAKATLGKNVYKVQEGLETTIAKALTPATAEGDQFLAIITVDII